MKLFWILKYGPLVFGAVLALAKQLEEQIDADGQGSEKAKAVDAVLQSFVAFAEDSKEDYEKLRPLVTDLTEKAVAFYKAVGVFK